MANPDAASGAKEGGPSQEEGGAQKPDQNTDSDTEHFNQLRVPDFDD